MIITSEDARAKKALSKELIELVGPKAKFHELPPEASEERFLKLEVNNLEVENVKRKRRKLTISPGCIVDESLQIRGAPLSKEPINRRSNL